MNEEKLMLTPEEEIELKELGNNRVFIVKNIIVGLIVFVISLMVYGLLVFYPFFFKISGEWTDIENQMYQINNKGKRGEFTIKGLSGDPNLSLVFQGDVVSAGSNRYKMKKNQPYLEINKSGVANEVIEEMKKQTEFYEISKETEEILLLKYTDKSIEQSFPDNQLDSLFYYELTPKYVFGQESTLKLRNTTFADPTVLFSR